MKEVHLPDVMSVSDVCDKIARDKGYSNWQELEEDYSDVEDIYCDDLREIYKSVIDLLKQQK